jgi:hypothetical protein
MALVMVVLSTVFAIRTMPLVPVLLTAVENGGAGRSKMVALGGVDLP